MIFATSSSVLEKLWYVGFFFFFLTMKTVLNLCHKTYSISAGYIWKNVFRWYNEYFSHLPYVFLTPAKR